MKGQFSNQYVAYMFQVVDLEMQYHLMTILLNIRKRGTVCNNDIFLCSYIYSNDFVIATACQHGAAFVYL